MCAKSFSNRFPLSKLNRKQDFQRQPSPKNISIPRQAGRGQKGISRRGTP